MPEDVSPPIRLQHEHSVYQNQFVTVHDDDVIFPSGRSGTYVKIVEGDGSPGVASVVTRGQQIALVRVYRYPIKAWEWGIPRGFGSSSDPETSIRRELREELGADIQQLRLLGPVHANSGLLAGRVLIYHATAGDNQIQRTDLEEVDRVAWVSMQDVLAMVKGGSLTDGFTLAALTLGTVHEIF